MAAGLWVVLGAFCLSGTLPAAEAQGRHPVPIPGQYIVVLHDAVPSPGAAAAEMARGHGLGLLDVYEHALKGFAATMPEARLRAVQNDPRVKYVEQDGMAFAIGETLPTGIQRIGGELSSTVSGDCDGSVAVDVAVIDTGIQANHPDLNVVGGVNYSNGPSWKYDDEHGHGTHVAGTIAARDNCSGVVGVAPGARLWAVKVLSNNGSGSWSNVIKGIDWCAARADTIEVVNMSLGGGRIQSVNDAVKKLVNKNVVVCVAAGNNGDNAAYYSPASELSAITVAALADYNGLTGGGASPTCANYGADDSFASFSNWSSDDKLVDIIAPGVCILSTYKGSSYVTFSGTSMASPHVAGAAALLLKDYGGAKAASRPSAATIRDTLISLATEMIPGTHGEGRSYPLLNVDPF